MPFQDRVFRPFTNKSILAIPQDLSGVFGIFGAARCLYVDEAEDVREALIDILAERRVESKCILKRKELHWAFEALPLEAIASRKKQLLFELDPPCNRRRRR